MGTVFARMIAPNGDISWLRDAACGGETHDLFFPDDYQTKADDAKAICRRCPVSEECTDYALANGIEFGVWGGLTPSERRKVAKSRAWWRERFA